MVDNSNVKKIDGELFSEIVENGARNLKANIQEVNDSARKLVAELTPFRVVLDHLRRKQKTQ